MNWGTDLAEQRCGGHVGRGAGTMDGEVMLLSSLNNLRW